jgi:ABC-2 type transport system permease protein
VIALFRKEINNFFSSIIGYVVIILFLLVNAIFFFGVFGQDNILDQGYANMNSFFENAPYIFLLLIPAITMRSFAEEKSIGTIESLITKPISETRIILAKYFAAIVLVIFSILPTFTYYFSLYFMGNPVGNIDTGSVMGSYLGLILLASIYISIGLYASSVTENQIVALLLSMALCLTVTVLFNYLGELKLLKAVDLFVLELGVLPHYVSISRGVIDTRDIVYFISANAFFLLWTKTVLQKRKW